jgi:hypothetical protein
MLFRQIVFVDVAFSDTPPPPPCVMYPAHGLINYKDTKP